MEVEEQQSKWDDLPKSHHQFLLHKIAVES